jgi:hypothetical protein
MHNETSCAQLANAYWICLVAAVRTHRWLRGPDRRPDPIKERAVVLRRRTF